jgi:hypothetical protein
MKTLFFTYTELQAFLLYRYKKIDKNNFKKTKTRCIQVDVSTLVDIDGEQVLFISNIDGFVLPNDDVFPQLRTLYGIPAGLLKSNAINHKLESIITPTTYSETDRLFLGLRRAMLYCLTWGIKRFSADVTETFFNKTLKNLPPNTSLLLFEIIASITQESNIPETKPDRVSINDTKFDYQRIWLGKAVGRHLLGGERMNDEQRLWFVNVLDSKQALDQNPFGDTSALLIAYQLTMKLYNEDTLSFERLLYLLNKTVYKNASDKNTIILFALLLQGLLQKQADNYFPVAGASSLFSSLESTAFMIALSKTFSLLNVTGFNEISTALTQPHDNCVNYYKTKNPSIKPLSWWVYGTEEIGHYPEQVPVIQPQKATEFLMEYDKVFSFDVFYSNTLLITDDIDFYTTLQKDATNYLFFDGRILFGQQKQWHTSSMLLTDSEKVTQGFTLNSVTPVLRTSLLPINEPSWVLITADYTLPSTIEALLKRTQKPEQLFVFNFESHEQLNESLFNDKELGFGKKTTGVNNKQAEKTAPTKGQFQAYLERIFPDVPVRIVNKPALATPWEMVNIGINMLQKTPLSQCKIIETRKTGVQKEHYVTILRSFSDIIVYDSEQRYMFMNL